MAEVADSTVAASQAEVASLEAAEAAASLEAAEAAAISSKLVKLTGHVKKAWPVFKTHTKACCEPRRAAPARKRLR